MKVVFIVLLMAFPFEPAFAIGGCQGPAVTKAASEVGFQKTDSIETKIAKSICYLNREKLYRSDPPPVGNDAAYGLDTRSAEEVLEQMPLKKGGSCGSYAVAVASLLMSANVSDADLKIVMAGENTAMKAICPIAGEQIAKAPGGEPIASGLSGHVFILFNSGHLWNLANTTNADCKKLLPDIAEFMSPSELDARMVQRPVSVTSFANLKSATQYDPKTNVTHPVFPQGLTIVGEWSPKDYPVHTFRTRYNLLASGNEKSNLCRYGADQIASQWP